MQVKDKPLERTALDTAPKPVVGQDLPARPPLAMGLVVVVSLAGAGLLAGHLAAGLPWSAHEIAAFFVLAALTVLAEQVPIRIRHGQEIEEFTITDVIWTAGLVLAPADVLIASVALGSVIGRALRRTPGTKIAFNFGQFVISLAAAEAVFHAFHAASALDPRTWAAAVLGMAVYFVLNTTLLALIISLAQRENLLEVLLGPMSLNVLHWAGNVAIGITAAVMWSVHPAGAIFLVLPLGLSYLAYVAWLNSTRERDRMRRLYEAGQVLLSRLEEGGDFRPFLEVVVRLVDADDVHLVVASESGAVVYGLSSDDVVAGRPGGTQVVEWALDVLPPSPHAKAEVALVGTDRDQRGALVAVRPDHFSPAERSLLESLAAQVYVKLRHIEVFSQSLQQGRELGDIIASSSDGIILVAGDGTVASWNPAMQAMTGYARAEAVGRALPDLGLTPDVLEAPSSGIGGSTFQYARKDGASRWLRIAASPMVGAESGTVVVVADVTAELEAELAKSDFIAAVSHELRTPLTPLKGYLTLFAGGQIAPGDPGTGEYFESMLKQANRLEELIGDLLDVSSFGGGKPNVRLADVDLVPIVEQAVADTLLVHAGRSISFSRGKDALLVMADPRRVAQVLANLLSNAVKFSPPDTPVEVRATRDGGTCVVAVCDQGAGIPAAEQDRVFQKFHRVDNTSTRTEGGTGLGLHIARQLVESMSGRMWLDSSPGQGSTFWFSLPLPTNGSNGSA